MGGCTYATIVIIGQSLSEFFVLGSCVTRGFMIHIALYYITFTDKSIVVWEGMVIGLKTSGVTNTCQV